MILGSSTTPYAKAGFPLYKAFEHLHDLGIHAVDVPGYKQYMPQYLPEREHSRLARKLEQLDMEAYSAIYLPRANPGSRDPEERMAAFEEMKPSARFIRNLNGKCVCFCEAAGRPDYRTDLSKEEALENSIETVRRFCEWCDDELNGLIVLLEIIPYGGNLCSVESMKDMCDKVGAPNLYINADLGHFNLQKINGRRFKLAGEKMISVHISDDDNRGVEGSYCERDCIVGEGTTNFTEYFAALEEIDIEGNARKAGLKDLYCIIEGGANNVIPNPDWSTMRARDYILEQIPALRNSVY